MPVTNGPHSSSYDSRHRHTKTTPRILTVAAPLSINTPTETLCCYLYLNKLWLTPQKLKQIADVVSLIHLDTLELLPLDQRQIPYRK